ncbi:hypothetical protein [Vibrio algarum]|uniref:Uncharacterized protein n=1 Tax=Vibrio algarum TaxID=3020714 RepID=A0ABT4YLF3_9VIBR|nr:hypothetical protein [Vibrio sp. KJ40-1]MDB1122250.1 hypothetical protein [Vibrio sp. KJ40-1]
MYKWLKIHQKKERRTQLRKKIANVNWPIVREHLYEFLLEFLQENKAYLSDFRVEKTDVNCVENGYWGFDSLQFFQNDRLTNTGEWETKDGERIDTLHFEYGVVLDINHSNTGRIQVFLKRRKCDISSIEHPSILLFYTDNPLELTEKRILKFMKQTVFYSRATSVDRRLSIKEKAQLFVLEFRSAVRLKSFSSYLYETLAKTFYAAVMAGVAILTLYVTYLAYLVASG